MFDVRQPGPERVVGDPYRRPGWLRWRHSPGGAWLAPSCEEPAAADVRYGE